MEDREFNTKLDLCDALFMNENNRFWLKVGKYGAYIYDSLLHTPITLNNIVNLLNEAKKEGN